jgi:hypothetical protein
LALGGAVVTSAVSGLAVLIAVPVPISSSVVAILAPGVVLLTVLVWGAVPIISVPGGTVRVSAEGVGAAVLVLTAQAGIGISPFGLVGFKATSVGVVLLLLAPRDVRVIEEAELIICSCLTVSLLLDGGAV